MHFHVERLEHILSATKYFSFHLQQANYLLFFIGFNESARALGRYRCKTTHLVQWLPQKYGRLHVSPPGIRGTNNCLHRARSTLTKAPHPFPASSRGGHGWSSTHRYEARLRTSFKPYRDAQGRTGNRFQRRNKPPVVAPLDEVHGDSRKLEPWASGHSGSNPDYCNY